MSQNIWRCFVFVLICLGCTSVNADVIIGSSGRAALGSNQSYSNAKLIISGDWINNGSFNPNQCTIEFQGTTEDSITNTSGETFYNLTINKSGGFVRLNGDVTVNGTLTLSSGTFDNSSARLRGLDNELDIAAKSIGPFLTRKRVSDPVTNSVPRSAKKRITPNMKSIYEEANKKIASDSKSNHKVAQKSSSADSKSNYKVAQKNSSADSKSAYEVAQKESESISPLLRKSKIDHSKESSQKSLAQKSTQHAAKRSFDPFENRRSVRSAKKELPRYKSSSPRATGTLTLSHGATISRATGTLADYPTLGDSVNVTYTGSTGVTTSYELPTSTTVLDTLTINNSGNVTLGADVTVNKALIFLSGMLNTDSFTLTLDSLAVISNIENISGIVERNLLDIGTEAYSDDELGISLTSGSTNITDLYIALLSQPVNVNGNEGISRQWRLSSTAAPTGRDLTLKWPSTVDNGLDRSTAQIWKSTDSGTSWNKVGLSQIIPDTEPRSIMATNITSFSDWTVSDGDNPLPIELSEFYAEIIPLGVKLYWQTASEVNNKGFYLYRDEQRISSLIPGQGISTTPHEYSFIDSTVTAGNTYRYQLSDINEFTDVETFHPLITVVIEEASQDSKLDAPKSYALHGNYPNPFNPQTLIRFDLPRTSSIELLIYDMNGQLVKRLIDGEKEAGYHSVLWNGKDNRGRAVNSGVYFYKIETEEFSETKQMILLK